MRSDHYVIIIYQMILAKIKEEEARRTTINNTYFHHSKKSSILKNQQPQPTQSIQTTLYNGQSSFRKLRNTTVEKRQSSQQKLNSTCSNFLKSFVTKIKRQKKRQQKKVVEATQLKCENNSKQTSPLPLIHFGKQQILVFQKIMPASYKPPKVRQEEHSFRNIPSEQLDAILNDLKFMKTQSKFNEKPKKQNHLPLLRKKISLVEIDDKFLYDKVQPWQSTNPHSDFLQDQIQNRKIAKLSLLHSHHTAGPSHKASLILFFRKIKQKQKHLQQYEKFKTKIQMNQKNYKNDFYQRLQKGHSFGYVAQSIVVLEGKKQMNIIVGAIVFQLTVDDEHLSGSFLNRFLEWENDTLYIMTLGVIDQVRKTGVASKLLLKAFEYCKQNQKIKLVSLHVVSYNERAIQFYKKHGFLLLQRLNQHYHIMGAQYQGLKLGIFVNGGSKRVGWVEWFRNLVRRKNDFETAL